LEKYVVKMGGNRNDSNETFGMSVRGVQSAIFTARVALEFKASLISKLGMKLQVLLVIEQWAELRRQSSGDSGLVLSRNDRHPLEAEVSRRDAAEDPLYQGPHSSVTNDHSVNCFTCCTVNV
jgi:hypothetical protein